MYQYEIFADGASDDLGLPYDPESLLHYRLANQRFITLLQPGINYVNNAATRNFGGFDLSQNDTERIRRLYRASSEMIARGRKLYNGETCTYNIECRSGDCKNGACCDPPCAGVRTECQILFKKWSCESCEDCTDGGGCEKVDFRTCGNIVWP